MGLYVNANASSANNITNLLPQFGIRDISISEDTTSASRTINTVKVTAQVNNLSLIHI